MILHRALSDGSLIILGMHLTQPTTIRRVSEMIL